MTDPLVTQSVEGMERRMRLLANLLIDRLMEENKNGDLKLKTKKNENKK